jgi:hypothetical protein
MGLRFSFSSLVPLEKSSGGYQLAGLQLLVDVE